MRLLLPVFVSLAIQVPPSLYWILFQRQHSPSVLIAAALSVIGPLLLLAARRFPGPVVALVTAAACVDLVLSISQPGPPFIALAFAIGGAVLRGARLWAWISVGTGWLVTLVVGFMVGLDWRPAQIAITTLGILIVFGLAEGMRTRREHYEEYRREYTQRKQSEVQAERVRIARELHDVLAHSLSQINVQASVGLHLMDKQPEKASEALASIKETSKTALDEVRSVLEVLRAEDGRDPTAPLVPEPDLSRLTGLAASVTSQGVEVTLSNSLDAAPQAVQLAIYRIVQEALTNVVRHARATRATVDISEADGSYLIAVADNGVGLSDGRDITTGRGLLGMRERAELLGGTLEVGPGPRGGLLVMVAIPQKEHA
ncbi:MAG TPA: sensor histidine kinase [Rhodoglobus sp.]|nr:sensor histidine kinase [Rhodoglobus sp.]